MFPKKIAGTSAEGEVPRLADLSKDLKAWRKRLSITQSQAAAVLDVSLRTYQGWEAGRDFDRATVLRYALAYVEKMQKSSSGSVD